MPKFMIGWFYIVTEEAKPILAVVFKQGVVPGAVITVPDEDFEILREGVMYLPVTVLDDKRIVNLAEAS